MTLELDESKPTEVKLLIPLSAGISKQDADTIMQSFVAVVHRMAADPEQSVTRLTSFASSSLIGTGSPDQHAAQDIPFGLAHASLERWATTDPSRTAIRTKVGDLSYGVLNARANAFAAHLRKLGTEHGDMITVYMDKSADTLVAIFGIMKAGAAFVPLDPQNPHERNKFIIQDTGAKRIITDDANRESCANFGLPLVLPQDVALDNTTVATTEDKNKALLDAKPTGLGPDSIAYAIYTSGSTGQPKGVLVPHSAVDAATRGMVEATAVTADWIGLWVLNYIFDASYYDVFTLLSSGAILCVASQDEILSDLTGHINDMGVQQVMLTPTITKLIRGGPSDVPGLKVLNVCGEKIDTNILQWADHVDVYNGYGPTEATILMTVSKVEPGSNLNSIGRPLRHVSAIIVPSEGDSLQPIPDGQVGELCVRGPQLAAGYLNRPEQTRAAFVRDVDGEPLYRTGDLAQLSEDGTLL